MSRRRGAFHPHRAGLLSVFVLGTTVGCGTEGPGGGASGAGGEEAGAARLTVGDLCPSCQPNLGGESSDFEGDTPECVSFLRRRNVGFDEAQAAGIDIARVLPLVTREFTMPLRWGDAEPDYSAPGPAGAMPASGFTPETTIHGVVSPASEIELVDLDPAQCDAAGVCSYEDGTTLDCAWYVASVSSTLDLTLELDTADAAIQSALLRGRLGLPREGTPLYPAVGFVGDLSLVQGTLRVGDGLPEPHTGYVRALLAFWPATVRGVLTPVLYPDGFVQQDVGDGDNVLVPSWSYAPLSARWPGDLCHPSELPIDDPAPEARAARERLSTEYPAARARVNDMPLHDASWRGTSGSGVARPVRVGLELASDPRPSCASGFGEPQFSVDVHVWSDDGRLDWTLPVQARLQRQPGRTPSLGFHRTEDFASDAPFWSSNLQGAELFGAAGAGVNLVGSYGLEDPSYVEGALRVRAVPACDRDPRCPAADAPDAVSCAECGSGLNIMTIEWSRYPEIER